MKDITMRPDTYKRLRQSLGLSQQSLADRLGIARETVARRESGVLRITPEAELAMRCIVREAEKEPTTNNE